MSAVLYCNSTSVGNNMDLMKFCLCRLAKSQSIVRLDLSFQFQVVRPKFLTITAIAR